MSFVSEHVEEDHEAGVVMRIKRREDFTTSVTFPLPINTQL